MTTNVKVPDLVHEKAQDVQDEYDYATLGEAIRHMCREGDYDV